MKNLNSAYRGFNLRDWLVRLKIEELHAIHWTVKKLLWSWMGVPTPELLADIEQNIPNITECIDFEIVRQRLKGLDAFPKTQYGVSLNDFFPELQTLLNSTVDVIKTKDAPPLAKAEAWLRPIASSPANDAELEAAIYLASRGYQNVLSPEDIVNQWHSEICYCVECEGPTGITQELKQRAAARELSLKQAADILRFNDVLPAFWGARHEDEDFVAATMLRTTERFAIVGFDEWWKSATHHLSAGPQYGIDHTSAAWMLFHWCRSDLALQIVDRQGLVAWLWALLNGPNERYRPWRILWSPYQEKTRVRDYIPVAGALAFVWHRIQPTGLADQNHVLIAAIDLLMQSQLPSGGWPIWADDSDPCILTTSVALHALALSRPTGWQGMAKRGSEWLWSQQTPFGYWYIEGGPSVMLTVLALDAIELAGSRTRVTFKIGKSSRLRASTSARPRVEPQPDPVYVYDGIPWYKPILPAMKPVSVDTLEKHNKVDVLLMTATPTELKQVLSLLSPPLSQKKILKVPCEQETYYIGRFGAYRAAVFQCNMGTEGSGGSSLAASAAIRQWKPCALIMLGIAFAADKEKHKPADILLATQIIPYETQKVERKYKIIPRSPIPPTSGILSNRFGNAVDWHFQRPDDSTVSIHPGAILSGNKLINNLKFKKELLNQHPEAIGGEMEGAGVWAAASREGTEWIVVKGVSDWGDGKKHDGYQEMAAAAAASLCQHVLSDKNALNACLRKVTQDE